MVWEAPLQTSKPLSPHTPLCSRPVFPSGSILCYFSPGISLYSSLKIIPIYYSCASSITKSMQVFVLRKTQFGLDRFHTSFHPPFISIPELKGICRALKCPKSSGNYFSSRRRNNMACFAANYGMTVSIVTGAPAWQAILAMRRWYVFEITH